MTIFERARALNFPLGQYVVVGSGPMEAIGLRRASDIDVVVTPGLHAELRASGLWREEEKYGKIFLQQEGVEVIPGIEWEAYQTSTAEAIASAMVIDGTPFLNLEELKRFKRAMGREKDLKDIELITAYLTKQ